MTSHLVKNSFLLSVTIIFFLLTVSMVSAQEKIGFSVSPTIFDMTANPGQAWNTTIRIINPNSFDMQLYIDTANFRPREETGIPEFIPVEKSDNEFTTFAEWISLEEFILVPAEKTIELPIRMNVPLNADPGGHFAAILIGTKPPIDQSSKTGVSTAQIISSLLFLRVTGEVSEIASIRSFRATDIMLEKPAATFELRIENKGNVHVQPQGEISIVNMWGKERGLIPVNQKTLFGNVLPQSVRKYSFDWESDWSIADIGRYKAKIALTYGNTQKQSLVAETAFWVIPWRLVAATLLVLALFVYGFITAIKIYVRRVMQLSGLTAGPSNSVSLTPKSKPLDLVAPFEVGMLDLRNKLEHSNSTKEKIFVYLNFIKQYRKFFFVLAGLIAFVWATLWYLGEGSEARDYTVTTESGEVITPDNVEKISDVREQPPILKEDKVAVNIVNRSGSIETARALNKRLSSAGYAEGIYSEEAAEEDIRTVIVFSPSLTDEALKLSAVLKNAPLSALPESSEANPELTIFLGTDL